jgi:hypothetical protein
MQEFRRLRSQVATRVEGPLSLRLHAEAKRRKITLAEVVREALAAAYPGHESEQQIAA